MVVLQQHRRVHNHPRPDTESCLGHSGLRDHGVLFAAQLVHHKQEQDEADQKAEDSGLAAEEHQRDIKWNQSKWAGSFCVVRFRTRFGLSVKMFDH